MFEVKGLECLQCGSTYPSQTLFEGCPACRARGKPANVTVVYESVDSILPKDALCPRDSSIWRYRAFLGSKGGEVSLGEGLTPLIECSRLAAKLGLPRFLVKDETQNPTGSYKDRLSSASVTRARAESAAGVATSSTGNHGASTAAYAARAGLQCIIFTVAHAPETMKLQMQALGAMVVATVDPRDRWVLLRHCVENLGWYSTGNYSSPPVGSSPYGIEGHKTIAYEICESLEWDPPDTVLMPVAYGDGLYGVFKGFRDLVAQGWINRVPRMVAVESGGSLYTAIREGLDYPPTVQVGQSVALSIHTPASTFQALKAIRHSGGTAVVVQDREILEAQKALGNIEGIFVEPASAAVVAGLRRLVAEGTVGVDEVVVGVLTSTGLKIPSAAREMVPELPVVKPDIADLRRALKDVYGYQLEN